MAEVIKGNCGANNETRERQPIHFESKVELSNRIYSKRKVQVHALFSRIYDCTNCPLFTICSRTLDGVNNKYLSTPSGNHILIGQGTMNVKIGCDY